MAQAIERDYPQGDGAKPYLAERIYKASIWGEEAPDELILWTMAEKFGWTLEYILGLPEARIREYFEIERGRGMARKSIVK